MLNKIEFGKKLSEYRKAKKLSQTKVGNILGVTPQAVSS
jgi:transcriptional regulator with XRE-family HTH domain